MDWKVVFALLIVFATLIYKANGRSSKKDAKLKGVNLKTKLHQKIFHYNYHHHHRHHQHHHHHHPHHHHDKHKHHHQYYHHHHHHHHHPHHHNPIKHYLHHSHHHPHPHHHHHHHHNHHPHKHPHQHPKQNLHPPPSHSDHHDNRRSHISHPLQKVPNKLKVHVHIKDTEAVKRQSLPDLLSNLGQNLMKLGKHMSIKKSNSSVPSTDNPDKKGNITEGLPIPQFTFNAEGLSSTSAVIPTHPHGKNVTVGDIEALLHKALDGMSEDEIESGSGSGSGGEMIDAVHTTEDSTTDASLTGSGSPLPQNEPSPEGADRRNQTFPEEPEIYLLSDRHSAYDSHEDTAEDSKFDNTDSKEKSRPVYGDHLNDADREKTGLTESADGHMAGQFGNMNDNGTRGEPLNSINQSRFDESRSPDMNSTFEDTEGKTDRETNSFALDGPEEKVTGTNATREQDEKAEASGSGDEPSGETNYYNDHTDQAEENMFQGDAREQDASNVPVIDEDENGSGQNTDQNGTENAKGHEHEQKAFFNKTAKQDTFDESRKAMPEETIDQQTAVHVEGNQIKADENKATFQQNRIKESQSEEVIDAAASEDKLMDKANIDRPGTEPVLEEHLDQGSTAQDVNEYSSGDVDPPATQPVLKEPERATSERNVERGFQTRVEQPDTHEYSSGDFNSPATQPVFNEPERAISEANIEKGFQTQNGKLNIQDVQQNQLNKPDQPVINTIDDTSDGNNFAQESTDESQDAWVQEQGPQTDNTGLSEGPSSSNDDYSTGVNTEGTQLADLYGETSQENSTEGEPDDIPVYTLSFPRSFATEESTTSPSLTAPSSSDETPSATYGETLTLPDGESSFSAIDAPSQDDQSPTDRIGYQRDMLDDPVQESLDTAVDSRRSDVAKLKVTT